MKREFQIKDPCSVSREDMPDTSGVSFCELCSKKVYDLADKTDNFSYFPFRKIAGGIFLSILFSNLNAQKQKIDTLETRDIQGMVMIAHRPENKDYAYPEPLVTRKLEIKPSADSGNLIPYDFITILTPFKRFKSDYAFKNHINIPADDIRINNILVFEGADLQNRELNANKYFLFLNKRHIKEDGILNISLNQAKKLPFISQNKDFIYFLDGEEITKKEFEQYQKENKIDSYFLPEIYAEELFGSDYYFENGAIISYRK